MPTLRERIEVLEVLVSHLLKHPNIQDHTNEMIKVEEDDDEEEYWEVKRKRIGFVPPSQIPKKKRRKRKK